MGCRACGSSGGGCQFLGTAATSQVVAEALGLALPHSALAPSGEPVVARARDAVGARAACGCTRWASRSTPILTSAAVENAMLVHAAFGGSTNLLLHIPGDRARRGTDAADGGRLDPRQPRDAAARGRAAERTARPSDRAGVHGGRRAGSDAASAAHGAAATATCSPRRATRSTRRSTGGRRATARRSARAARRRARRRSRRRDHGARRGAHARGSRARWCFPSATSRPRVR